MAFKAFVIQKQFNLIYLHKYCINIFFCFEKLNFGGKSFYVLRTRILNKSDQIQDLTYSDQYHTQD